MKILIGFFLIFFSIVGFAQPYSSLVPDSLINKVLLAELDFLEGQTENKVKISTEQISWLWSEVLDENYTLLTLSIFLQNEIEDSEGFFRLNSSVSLPNFFVQQINSIQNKRWATDKLKEQLVNDPKNRFYALSIPIFNKSKTVAYQYFEFNCKRGCSNGGINIFHRKEGEWLYHKTIGQWTE